MISGCSRLDSLAAEEGILQIFKTKMYDKLHDGCQYMHRFLSAKAWTVSHSSADLLI